MKLHNALLVWSIPGALAIPSKAHNDVVRSPLDKRQFDISSLLAGLSSGASGGGLAGLMGRISARAVKTDTMEPRLRKEAKRERLWFGPFTLPGVDAPRSGIKMPLQMDPIGTQISRQISGFCTNCTVLYTKGSLFFENGTEATVEHGVYEHHVVMVDLAKRSMPFYICAGQQGFLGTFPAVGFMVSGNDVAANMFTTPDGTFNSGYNVGKTQMIAMQAELVNYRKEEQKVYVVVEYEHITTAPEEEKPADSTVSLFSVTGCNLPDYHRDLKNKIYNMTSASVPLPKDGFIINAKGHLHDGGDHINLELNGKPICTSNAVYGPPTKEDGQEWMVIKEMTQCTTPVPVKKGDKLQMTSYYDTEKYPPRPTKPGKGNHSHEMADADEMGVFFLNFAATTKTESQLRLNANGIKPL